MFKEYLPAQTKRFQRAGLALVILVTAGIGTYLLTSSHAATPFASQEVENGTLAGSASVQTSVTASGGKYVQFGPNSSGSGIGGGNNMAVGLNEAGWGAVGATDTAGAVKYDRLDTDDNEPASDFTSVGVKVDTLFSGPYNTGGVSAINASSWASNALSWYQSNGCTPTECPMLEVLNEPGGTWFWGSNALSQTNATAYANLVKTTYTTFHTAYGATAPLILATYDGAYGNNGDETFGQEWWNSSMSSYVDGVVVHPYGGTGTVSQSKLGNRQLVTDAHTATGKPVYVTEVGWPTAVGQPATGDSLQWSDDDQCNNIYNFINWSRGTGYVNAVMLFGYRDYDTNDFYGVETSGGTKKPSYTALKAAALGQPNPCPDPATF